MNISGIQSTLVPLSQSETENRNEYQITIKDDSPNLSIIENVIRETRSKLHSS